MPLENDDLLRQIIMWAKAQAAAGAAVGGLLDEAGHPREGLGLGGADPGGEAEKGALP